MKSNKGKGLIGLIIALALVGLFGYFGYTTMNDISWASIWRAVSALRTRQRKRTRLPRICRIPFTNCSRGFRTTVQRLRSIRKASNRINVDIPAYRMPMQSWKNWVSQVP